MAVDEVQDPVMGAAEVELGERVVGVAHEVAVREEQEFDDVPDRLGRVGAGLRQGVG